MRDLDCQSGLKLWDRWDDAGCRWEWVCNLDGLMGIGVECKTDSALVSGIG